MKIEPTEGQVWRNKRNGTRLTITDSRPHRSNRGDWDRSIEYTTERGHQGSTFYPNFHGRFEFVEDNGEVPTSVALTKPLAEWPTDLLRRIIAEAEETIRGRISD